MCSGGVPGCSEGVPGVFRVCSGVFRVLQTPIEYHNFGRTANLRLTLGRPRGGGGGSPPIRFFWNFSETNYLLDLRFSVAVHISLRHILTQVW